MATSFKGRVAILGATAVVEIERLTILTKAPTDRQGLYKPSDSRPSNLP